MNQNDLKIILNNLYKNKLSPEDALKQLKSFSYENMGFAKIDHNREIRSGLPEVIYSKGKSVAQIKKIIASLSKAKSDILATKLSADAYKSLKPYLPKKAIYNKQGQILIIRNKKVVSFSEKKPMQTSWINGGFFIINKRFLKFIKKDKTILERDPLERVANIRQLSAFKHYKFWQCMDTKRDLDNLKLLYSKNKPWLR